MKRFLLPVLMIIALLFGGCGEAERLESGLGEARERWESAQELSFSADMTADLGSSIFSCGLVCTRSAGETVVELTAPDSIAGIRARVKEGGTELEFDGLILALGDVTSEGLSPLSAVTLLMDALLGGHISGIWAEDGGELAAAEVYISETEYAKLWFSAENFIPVHAELVSGGRSVVKCSITSFTEE